MKKKREKKSGFPLSHADAVKYGKLGGNPLLLSLKKGKKITVDGKRYVPKNKR